MDKQKQTPYHIEAAQYGANLKQIKDGQITSYSKAATIRQVWDYRQAGLKVNQARDLLNRWLTKSYHRKPDYSWSGHYKGRIIALGQLKERAIEKYRKFDPTKIRTLYAGEKLTWNDSQVKIRVKDRVIVVDRYEDVTWPKYKSGRQARWPESTKVYYVSRLIRDTKPTLREVIDNHYSSPLAVATEKYIWHNCRGNWLARVVKELLEIEGYKLPARPPMAPSTVYKIVEQNGCLRSVFAPEITYPIKSWVGEKITGPEHGEGGIYCYCTPDEAIDAARQGDVFNAAWAAGKTLVLTECWTKDHPLPSRFKICVETLRINKVLHEVSHEANQTS